MSWFAIDVGGANLKFSDGAACAGSRPFPLWKHPDLLVDQLRSLLAEAPPEDGVAVTMTGELADCFSSKADGVAFILSAVSEAAGDRTVVVYLTDGRMVAPAAAASEPLLAAAANWHALAAFAGRYARQGATVLLDIGSTTCDVIPLIDGHPAACGRNDTQRLLAGELLYTGVERTPVCAVTDRVPYRGYVCTLAQELFATMRDVYLVLGELPERLDDCDTADGRPATVSAACARLGRMICADRGQFSRNDALAMARAVAGAQAAKIASALGQVASHMPEEPRTVVLSGHGDFAARRALACSGVRTPVFSLSEHLGAGIARAATAYALAVLAREARPQ